MSKHNATLEEMRHTAAHILAAASTQLRADTKLGVGPAIDDGFYHDIDVADRYTEDDLVALQKEMEKIKKMNLPITQREVSKDEARQLFAHDPYKLELIEELPGDTVGVSDMGDGFFVTLCRGGHAHSTGDVGHFKLTRLSGVYWKGDSTKSQLQRIYGILFPTAQELKEHVTQLEEAKKRDHKKLGKELELFTFSELVGPGLPLWMPKGTILRNLLDDFVWELRKTKGYQKVTIPHITKKDLYIKSGHWAKYASELFRIITREGHEFAMKPMNCPHHTQIFAAKPRSYREMPQRYAETTMCYRDEQTGELNGLSRVRAFTQDDAHVFCRQSQVVAEINSVWDIVDQFYSAFGFTLKVRLSSHDPEHLENYLGTEEAWVKAEEQLKQVILDRKVEYIDGVGEAAFYGPKLDFLGKDAIGREWQVATIQLDFNQPEGFDLSCINEKGEKERIYMIHAAIMGSIERFLSIIIEHYAGAFPLWLAPLQVAALPITTDHVEHAQNIVSELEKHGVRVSLDDRSESIGKKIREAEKQKIPLMLIIGKQEVEKNSVTIRRRGSADQETLDVPTFITSVTRQITERK